MQQTNDLHTSQLAGSQGAEKLVATAANSVGLPTFLAGLPSAALSETGRRNVCQRFGLTDDALTTAMVAYGPPAKRRMMLPIPAKEFGADALDCAMMLTGTIRPTAAQLDEALLEMYPVGGPTAASLVAAGWLVSTIDKKCLRLPPLSIAADASLDSLQSNGH